MFRMKTGILKWTNISAGILISTPSNAAAVTHVYRVSYEWESVTCIVVNLIKYSQWISSFMINRLKVVNWV